MSICKQECSPKVYYSIGTCTKAIVLATNLAKGTKLTSLISGKYSAYCDIVEVGCSGEVYIQIPFLPRINEVFNLSLSDNNGMVNFFTESCTPICEADFIVSVTCDADLYFLSNCFKQVTTTYVYKEPLCTFKSKILNCSYTSKDMKKVSINGTSFDLPPSTILVNNVRVINPELLTFLQAIDSETLFTTAYDSVTGEVTITASGENLIEFYTSCTKVEKECL